MEPSAFLVNHNILLPAALADEIHRSKYDQDQCDQGKGNLGNDGTDIRVAGFHGYGFNRVSSDILVAGIAGQQYIFPGTGRHKGNRIRCLTGVALDQRTILSIKCQYGIYIAAD